MNPKQYQQCQLFILDGTKLATGYVWNAVVSTLRVVVQLGGSCAVGLGLGLGGDNSSSKAWSVDSD